MNKSKGITPIDRRPGFNTTRPLPAVPPRVGDGFDTMTADARPDGEHNAPELQADSSNLSYASDESGGEDDKVSSKPKIRIELCSVEMATTVTNVEKPGTGFSNTPSENDELALPDFLSELTRAQIFTDALQPPDSGIQRSTTSTSSPKNWRLKLGIQQHDKKKRVSMLNSSPVQSPEGEAKTSTQSAALPTSAFVPVSPRKQTSGNENRARMLAPKGGRPLSVYLPPRHIEDVSAPALTQRRTELPAEQPKTTSTRTRRAAAPRELIKRGAVPLDSVKKQRIALRKEANAVIAGHANMLNLKMLEEELAQVDHVYNDLLSMTSGEADDAAKQQQQKSENS